MTTRYQSLRSSISGNLPAAGTRLPGELWVNFPDLQMGLIDASKTAQKLIAVRYFSTTATYAAGDVVVQAGAIYVANGAVPPGAFTAAQWTKVSTAADLAGYLPLAGGTMAGPIVSVTGGSINGAAGTARSLFGTTALSKRWELQLGGPSAEGGSNAGSNFNLIAYNDAGAVLSTPLSIARATGAVTFGSSVTIPSLTLAALDSTPIGQTTPAAGSFTTLTSTGGALNGSLGATTPAAGSFTTLTSTGGALNGSLGATTPAAVTATTLTATTSTLGAASVTSLNGGQLAGMRNMVINGTGRFDQRFGNAITTPVTTGALVYFGDRWAAVNSQPLKFNVYCGIALGTPIPGSNGLSTGIIAQVASAYTPVAADYFEIVQVIEGRNIARLGWGSPGASSVTLSFWALAGVAGTYCVALSNGAGSRYYLATYTLAASVWTYVKITIPGDTAGTWAVDNTAGLVVRFTVGYGSSYVGTAGAWGGAGILATAGSVNLVANSSTQISIAGVQLEAGSVATPYEWLSYGAELALCQRYYQKAGLGWAGGWASPTQAGIGGTFAVSMRATPTVALTTSAPTLLSFGTGGWTVVTGSGSTVAATSDPGATVATIAGFTGVPVGAVVLMNATQLTLSAEL